MMDPNCLFCKIVDGTEPSKKIWENEEFVCIENKYPVAPVHVLVIPKTHIRKPDVGTSESGEFWGRIMSAVFSVVYLLKLSLTGYKLVNNGAGYNHFEHEHMHILGGSKSEPAGKT